MGQVLTFWSSLDGFRRLTALAIAGGIFALLLTMGRMAATPGLTLLYSGLDPAAAGEVVGALDAAGATYEVRGDAIYVDGGRRDELRLRLAADGLPANGPAGYELLDRLSGFGTTSQMFDAAYWRAKEGELARTIRAGSGIRQARVHIAAPSSRPFSRAGTTGAAVNVTTAAGSLSAEQAQAIRFLVASSVAGLSPSDVSVIDSVGGLVAAPGDAGSARAASDRAAELRDKVTRILEARVGSGRAVVEISVDTANETEEIVERRIDPASRVAISQDKETTTATAKDGGGGDVTVASNLPDGDAGEGAAGQSSNEQATRERTNFDLSETSRQVRREPGDVRRISVAVLLDGVRETQPDGTELWSPRPEDEIAVLRDLVASAVGFDEARGDTITLRSLEFRPLPELGTDAPAAAGLIDRLDVMTLAQLAVVGIVTLLLGLFVIRPLLAPSRAAGAPAALAPPAARSSAEDVPDLTPLDGEIDTGDMPDFPMNAAFGGGGDLPDLGDFGPGGGSPADRLKRLIENRQSETVEILRGWMEGRESSA